MAAVPAKQRADDVPCPDPTAHGHKQRLSEQASTAALFVTDPARSTGTKRHNSKQNLLGPDGKLSSSSAATSLKYARPQDLPSFPSRGGAAGAASKAALLASDYKMKDLWQPELSTEGSKAALLAQRDGGKLDLWQPTASKDGNSAAVLAMRAKGLSPELDRGYTRDGKHRALLAANLSIHRGRSSSLPTQTAPNYTDSLGPTRDALNAATASHGAGSIKGSSDGWNSDANQAARFTNVSSRLDPKLFGQNPNLDIDPEATRRQAALRASAVSMAKQMYEHKHRSALSSDLSGGVEGAEAANARHQRGPQMDVKQEALRYITLQDAAHKLAQEKLARVDKNIEATRYREYYGFPDEQASPRRALSRRSIRARGRRRTLSDGDLEDSDDEGQARRIRRQMSQLNTGLSQVDEKKRADDHARLVAAAEKRVHAQMHDMDEKVYADTGKVPPAMQEEWDEKARKRAQEERDLAARPENKGKTHIGGGRFIDQAAIEAIAAERLKATLDEINDTAEKRRAKDEELRQEKEVQQRTKLEEKRKHREEREEQKRVKNEDRAAVKKEKEEAKARKAEEKREKRRSKEGAGAAAAVGTDGATDEEEDTEQRSDKKRGSMLSRFSSKLRRQKKSETSGDAVENDEKEREPGTLAGGVAAVHATDHATSSNVRGPTGDDVSELSDDVHDSAEGVPTKGTQRTETGDTFHTSSSPSPYVRSESEPERHSSPDVDSDEETSEDIESVSTEDEHSDVRDAAVAGGVGAVGLGVYESTKGDDAGPAPHTIRSHESGEANVGDSHAQPAHDTIHRGPGDETGPAPHTIGPHRSDIANIIDPRVQPDPEEMRKSSGDETGPAPHTIGPHRSDTANILDPRVLPDPEEMRRASGDETGPAPHTIGSHRSDFANIFDPRVKPDPEEMRRSKGDETGPAPHTIGPHRSDVENILDPCVKPEPEEMRRGSGDETGPALHTIGPHGSDIANILDPRVKPDPEEMRRSKGDESGPAPHTIGPHRSNTANILSPHVQPDPKILGHQKNGAVAPAPTVKTGPDEPLPAQDESADKEPKGIRGFFSKFRHKHSRSESETHRLRKEDPKGKAPEPKAATDALPSTSAASGGSRVSPSSPKGHRSDLSSVSSVSAESGSGDPSKGTVRTGREVDAEQIEESRDQFDESLVPFPAFAGQPKSGSPVRETRFREEV